MAQQDTSGGGGSRVVRARVAAAELERATALAAVGEDAFLVAREGPGVGCARVDLTGQRPPHRGGCPSSPRRFAAIES